MLGFHTDRCTEQDVGRKWLNWARKLLHQMLKFSLWQSMILRIVLMIVHNSEWPKRSLKFSHHFEYWDMIHLAGRYGVVRGWSHWWWRHGGGKLGVLSHKIFHSLHYSRGKYIGLKNTMVPLYRSQERLISEKIRVTIMPNLSSLAAPPATTKLA